VKREDEEKVYDGGLNILARLLERYGRHRSEPIEPEYGRMTACCSGRCSYVISRSRAKSDLAKL